jgi:uncharacterized protein
MMTRPKLLLVYLDETDRHGNVPAYEAVIRKLLHSGVSGATAAAGIMGFGSNQRVHHKRLLGVSDDRPVTISAIDEEDKIRHVIPELRKMLPEALIAIADIEVVP